MIPQAMGTYFLASAGASATLVGLIFVAISLWPREQMLHAPPTWRAVAGGAFFALLNAFFVSLFALNPWVNLGWPALALGLLGLANSLSLGVPLLRSIPDWRTHIRAVVAASALVVASLLVYAAEGYFGVRLLLRPDDTFAVGGIALVLAVLYALGLIRAWELLGIEQIGLRRILNPLQPATPSPGEPSAPEERGDERSKRSTGESGSGAPS
ncbi:MAG TPA: hypothetical protein VGP82_25370 [Ktedonobacterales bacterium]|nr:hypothetical protein [Ktedonobacterales bacterium]